MNVKNLFSTFLKNIKSLFVTDVTVNEKGINVNKNGNVTTYTLTVNLPTTVASKSSFAATNWGSISGGFYPLTIASGGKNVVAVYKTVGSTSTQVNCTISVTGNNIVIYSVDKFAGYVLLM